MRHVPPLAVKGDQRMDERYRITELPLSIDAVMTLVASRNAGAVLTFAGTVREWTGERHTHYLIYESYVSMAERMLRQIGDEIEARWPGARCAIHHRVGRLEVSEIAVAIAVSAPRRGEAYEASRYAIERVKQLVPIWKQEHGADGSVWVGDQLETTEYPNGKPNVITDPEGAYE